MKRNAVVALVIAAFLVVLVWAGLANARRRHREEQAVQRARMKLVPAQTQDGDAPADLRGKAAPLFKLTALDGTKLDLAALKGKPVIVNFWATWCAPCKVEMPWFEEYRKQFAGSGLTVIGITEDTEQPKETVKATAARVGATYPIAMSDHKVDDAYGGAEFIPSTFYINREGVIVAQSNGLAPKQEMLANIQEILTP